MQWRAGAVAMKGFAAGSVIDRIAFGSIYPQLLYRGNTFVPMLSTFISGAALLAAGTLLGAAVYDAVVVAPNLRGGAAQLENGRLFLSNATPARLFRVLSPLTQVLVVASLAVNWSDEPSRWSLMAAFVALLACDVITFRYHYPRNALMFTAPLTVAPARLARAAKQWAGANRVRVVLVFVGWCGALVGLVRTLHP